MWTTFDLGIVVCLQGRHLTRTRRPCVVVSSVICSSKRLGVPQEAPVAPSTVFFFSMFCVSA